MTAKQDTIKTLVTAVGKYGPSLKSTFEKMSNEQLDSVKPQHLTKHIQNYADKIENPDHYVKYTLPAILENTKPGQLQAALNTLLEHIQNYKKTIGNPDYYVINALPKILEKLEKTKPKQLQTTLAALLTHIQHYADTIGDPFLYINYALPSVLEKTEPEQLPQVLEHINNYITTIGDPEGYAEYTLPKVLKKLEKTEPEQIEQVLDHINKYITTIGKPDHYVKYALPTILEKLEKTEPEQLQPTLDALLTHIQHYKKEIGNPDYYVEDTLPTILEKLEKTKPKQLQTTLKNLETTLFPHIQHYKKEIGNPLAYVTNTLLPEILKNTKPEQLQQVLNHLETTLFPHIQHYIDKIGNPYNYVRYTLPEILKDTKPEQLEPILNHINNYITTIGKPDKYVRFALPKVLKNTKPEQLPLILNHLNNYITTIGKPDHYVEDALPKMLTSETLEQVIKDLDRIVLKGARHAETILPMNQIMQNKQITNDQLYRTHYYLKTIHENDKKLIPKVITHVTNSDDDIVKNIENFTINKATKNKETQKSLREIFNSKKVDTSKKTNVLNSLLELSNTNHDNLITKTLKNENNLKDKVNALTFLPGLHELHEEGILEKEDMTEIFSKPGIINTTGKMLKNKISSLFDLNPNVKSHEDFNKALNDLDFIRTLFHLYANYNKNYQQDLKKIIQAYHAKGIDGVEDLKFNPAENELAIEQVHGDEKKLNELRKLGTITNVEVSSNQTTLPIEAAESHLSQFLNHYKDAEKVLNTLKDKIDGLNKNELNDLIKKNNKLSETFNKKVKGLEKAKAKNAKSSALKGLLKELKKPSKSFDSLKAFVKDAETLKGHRGDEEPAQREAFNIFSKNQKKYSKALDELISAMNLHSQSFSQEEFSKLSLALKDGKNLAQFKLPESSAGNKHIFAEITRDPQVILRFGFNGPSGSNCHSPSGSYNMGLIGMLRDANQEIVHFYEKDKQGNKKTLGVQHLVSGLDEDSGELVHVSEPTYSNFPDLRELFKASAKPLVKSIKKKIPSFVLGVGNHPDSEVHSFRIGPSHSKGYFDALGGSRTLKDFTLKAKFKRMK